MNEMIQRIEAQMKALNLKAMIERYKEFGEMAAERKLCYEEYLSLLLEEELRGKTERSVMAKIHKARFSFVKTIEEFDFTFQPGLSEKELLRLCSPVL